MFLSVVYVDTTNDTNNEGRPLLSMNGKDTTSLTFTISRACLPNQKMLTFLWVFCVLLPKIFGNRVLSKIQVLITDGDSQETSQMDNAIDQFFPSETGKVWLASCEPRMECLYRRTENIS